MIQAGNVSQHFKKSWRTKTVKRGALFPKKFRRKIRSKQKYEVKNKKRGLPSNQLGMLLL